jgi:CBS domain-containing protein
MIVRDLMWNSPANCTPNTNLAAVAELLWTCGSGALPVVDSSRVVLGIITDRDICVAVGTKDRRPSDLVAEKVMSRQVATCQTVDEIHVAIKIMRTRKVRRLPVVNEAGKLEGILCMSDLILDARHDDGTSPSLSYEDVMDALKGIYCHRYPVGVADA